MNRVDRISDILRRVEALASECRLLKDGASTSGQYLEDSEDHLDAAAEELRSARYFAQEEEEGC